MDVVEIRNISFLERLFVRLGMKIRVGRMKKDGWKGFVDVYAVRCPKHGIVFSRVHGYGRLECSECFEETPNTTDEWAQND